jgi:N-acetyl-anhydromuramyl-L-alanine amidase AmpD
MTITRKDTGPAVTEVQTLLLALGYTLPRYGADGNLGGETIDAFERFMRDHAAEAPPTADTIDDTEIELLRRVAAAAVLPLPSWLVDRRRFATKEHDYGARPWSKVTGITLHQTACEMGLHVARYDTIGAHFVVMRDGIALWMHDATRLIGHGGQRNPPHAGWNPQCIGIEIDGLFAGIAGDPRTVWDDPSTKVHEHDIPPTDEQIVTTKNLCRWIVGDVAAHGGKIGALVAHRQASSDRESDPGSAVWQQVAMPLHAELGLTDGGPGFTVGYGLPIPVEWDSSRVGIRYR